MDVATTIGLVALVLAHVPPSLGVLGRPALTRLYDGVRDLPPSTVLLLQHRAAGFAAVAGFAVAGLVDEDLAGPALALGGVSTATYLGFWIASPAARTPATTRVALVDVVALVAVAVALVARLTGS